MTGRTLGVDASKWYWVPIGVGLLSTVMGPALYCSMSPFYGLMLAALNGFIQAIVVLWRAIASSDLVMDTLFWYIELTFKRVPSQS